ncbi:Cell morphogenesis protein PAG1 [Lithohypha guttulata]|uniref:Cell morphogenesis protein PAG1 n=1 Tax=Lithohypha guttulata TaxID=1690604 RepID=UPI002DE04CE0|nr:Cell morphogenesis protein PAG1 [Lithohypha guttulata]
MASPTASFPLSAHLNASSIDSTINLDSSGSLSTASARTQSSTSRAGAGHAYGSSINTQPDGRTPSEYAMHHLLNAFVCGAGADPAFDQLLLALGHVTKHHPKALVDSLMLWRQTKADLATASRKHSASLRSPPSLANLPASLSRRYTEPVQDAVPVHPGTPASALLHSDELTPEEHLSLDRQATVSIFILCRGLIEVFDQSTLDAITPDLASKLEGIVFEQLRAFEPVHLNTNKIRTANWRIYSHLLGCMSKIDFVRVANPFLNQLKVWQQDIATNLGTTTKAREVEARLELLLSSMQLLRLGTGPSDLTQSCDFLIALAHSFASAHGPRIKQGYCSVFESLLLQLASRPDVTEQHIKFKEFVETVNPRINQMLTKMRHWASALGTSITLLCLSPLDIFHAQWMPQVNALAVKLRERSTRTPAMRAICQFTWAYLKRSSDSQTAKVKRIEEVIKLVLPPGKKSHLSTEPSMAEATISFIRLIGVYYPDLCFKLAILPLISSDGTMSSRELRIEHLEPEKVTIGIKAFLSVVEDKEKGLTEWITFPEFEAPLPALDSIPGSPMPFALTQAVEIQPVFKRMDFSFSTLPINTAALDEPIRAYFANFCEILGKITVLCDNAFGSSAALSEKFTTITSKTPLVDAFNTSKRDDGMGQEQKQSFYELLNVAIQALPRCLSENVPLSPLINLLCTASAHTQPHIATAAVRSLKAIAEQGLAHTVATAFPRFIFSYDHQYSTMSDDGRLGPCHIEMTLTLYLELLQIWIAQIQKRTAASQSPHVAVGDANSARALRMERTNLLSFVDEIEGYGLFFLCSQSRSVRSYAIKVLELVLQFDKVLGKDEQARIISVLQSNTEQVLNLADDSLNALERSRLQKDRRRKGPQNVLLELSSSENHYDAGLWFKAFPNVVRNIFETCPHAAALSREFVCDRLALMLTDIERIASTTGGQRDLKLLGRSADTPVGVFLDQWKLYLVMACVTLSSTGGQTRGQLDISLHSRKTSKNTSGLQDRLTSARALFSAVIPLLGSGIDTLRSAVVTALGSINRKLYRILLESLQYAVITCNDEAKARRGAHVRTPSSPSRSQMTERMRAEVTCIYKLTASFLRHNEILRDEWILSNLMNYAKDLRLFLSDSDIHSDWKFARLRFHYCGLVDVIYENIKRFPESSPYMSFESRKSAFMLMEEWCGYQTETHNTLWREAEGGDRSLVAKEKISLRTAALSAMATLCAGPVSVITDTNTLLQFNVSRMLAWIDSIFTSREHKLHEIGQRALRNLIIYNANTSIFVEHAIQCCYGTKGLIALENCFKVIADVLTQHARSPISSIKVLGAVMFTLGHDSRDIRIRSARLLRFLDEKEQKSSNLQHFDISISDKTRAVYKAAQFEYCRRLAQTHPDLAFHVFSEFCLQFRNVTADIQRGMVAAILPWLQMLELQLLPDTNAPTELSYMLLVNMVEITIRFSSSLHNEVQALWQALATGPYGGNVQLILDFVIDLSLERREQNFIYCAKQIVVYLSVTPAGSKIFEHLLLHLAPKNMPNEKRTSDRPPPEISQLPYVANLETVLPTGARQATFSLGQISLVLLVDLLVPPYQITQLDALKLLHAVFILWDHHTPTVQEHAREMLVHLMHTLVISSIDSSSAMDERLRKTEELVEAIRDNAATVAWSYSDVAGKDESQQTHDRVPLGMSYLAEQIVDLFSAVFDDLSDAWAKEALHWASVCPVRHLACRSFQVFRCISFKLDSALLSDMLARLSNTIAEEHADYQTFSLEILTTLKIVIAGLETKGLLKFPQLLWTTVACLNTIHEAEFLAAIEMLEQLAGKFDFADPLAVDAMLRARPAEWEGNFEGICPLVYKGLRSSQCFERTLSVMESFTSCPNSELLGTSDRLLFDILAHLPQFMEAFKQPMVPYTLADQVVRLSANARGFGFSGLETALNDMTLQQKKSPNARLFHVLSAVKDTFFPFNEAEALIFTFGLLSNATTWFRRNILEILCSLVPMINMNNPRIREHGADLISPLLRLLQTDLCDKALKVMDHIMEVNVTPLERHHLRMSMASGTARAIRKEYERTQSLYGIPESSGWSVATPAIVSAQTRSNVHHVFFSCSDVDGAHDTPSQTPEVEFHTEEEYGDSYFPPHIGADVHGSFETSTIDISIGEIVSSLDSLDDFFEENDSPTTPTTDPSTNAGLNPSAFFSDSDHETNVYDQQTAPIISRSLNRTSSSLSFQNGLVDPRPPTSHYHRSQISTSSAATTYQSSFSSIDEGDGPGPSLPTIDKQSPVVTHVMTNALPHRPGLHFRSITSPANQYSASNPTGVPGLSPQTFGDQHHAEDIQSDSENSPFPNLVPTTSDGGTKSVTVTPTSATDTSAGFMRRGMRRLTGGRSESAKEKARLRAPSAGQTQYLNSVGGPGQSPRMPRIPSEYLSNTPNALPVGQANATNLPITNPAQQP